MALTVSQIKLGARRVFWDTPGTELELGLTMEGTVLQIQKHGEEVYTEQYGIMPVDYVYQGEVVTVRARVREWGAIGDNSILKALLPGSTDSTGPTTKAWQFGAVPGVLASSIAKQLRLHPMTNATTTDYSDNVVIYLACPIMAAEVEFANVGRGGVWDVSWLALVDTSKSDGNLLGRWKLDAA